MPFRFRRAGRPPWVGSVDGDQERAPTRSGAEVIRLAPLALGGTVVLDMTALPTTLRPVYVALGAAALVGALVTVPWRTNGASSSLLIVPVISIDWRLGESGAPLVLAASLIANVARGATWPAAAAGAIEDSLAFAAATVSAASISQTPLRAAAFALVFVTLRFGLWTAATRVRPRLAQDLRVDQPDMALSLIVAPLGAVALVSGGILGDGGMLLALAAVLPVLWIVAEWWHLRVARIEAELERDRLGRAREWQEEFIHLITHEVRNPLTTVLGYSQLARSSLDPGVAGAGEVRKHLDRVYRAGKVIERLTENLLQLSKVEDAEDIAATEEVDLAVVAREVAAEIEPLAERKHQHLLLDLPDEAPIARGSGLLLREALSNLLSNAVKYTPEGGSVRIWTRSGPEPGMATLGVTDNGFGLSETDQARLFTKFFRSEDTRVARERGAGLGLALTQAIVRRMGGQILVESQLNQGATFQVRLASAGEEGGGS